MSWIQKLYETYENCHSMIGIGLDEKSLLLPICHTTQNAQIEIAIDSRGNFLRAKVVPKNEARTIIPCTEKSGGRTSGEAPHPLCDKLQYIAGDYKNFGSKKKPYFGSFMEQLREWCESIHSHPKAQAVFRYLAREEVIKDLLDYGILFAGKDGKLLNKWDKTSDKDVPEIFKVVVNADQSDVFVRWIVESSGDPKSAVWSDPSLFDCWIKYYSSIKENLILCYVTGVKSYAADQHPAKIRNSGDKAKLISSNDVRGFTFRGRFATAEQVCGVGFEVTQKAHNALRWLISKQGYRRGDHAVVAWATSGKDIPDPLADSLAILKLDHMQSNEQTKVSTAQEFALKLNKRIAGYSAELGKSAGIVIMGLDAATPGRMAITFYRELEGSEFLERIEKWHNACCWFHDYRYVEVIDNQSGGKKNIRLRFIGAPSPSDIAEAAYGSRLDDKLKKAAVERILPCIIDGQQIPRDIVESSVRRACNRIGMENWEWGKVLSIACALYNKLYGKGEFDMALDESRRTRDYLYGRLLALADNLEEWALKESGESRQTNAARLMQRFSEHPYTTWRTLELSLGPYKAKLGRKSHKLQSLMTSTMAMFEADDFANDKKLSGEFLLGYHCQREALWKRGGEGE